MSWRQKYFFTASRSCLLLSHPESEMKGQTAGLPGPHKLKRPNVAISSLKKDTKNE